VILAVDQGTTATTCLIVDRELAVRGRGSRPVGQAYPQPGWIEHDPDQLVESVKEAAALALADAGIDARELVAAGIANQRETAVVWRRSDGRPLAAAIVWQDRRTADVCARLPADLIRARTGLVPDPHFSATKFRWLLDHHPAGGEELLAGTVDSWLVWRLSGGAAHVTDRTNASRTMLLDLRDGAWDGDLLRLFGLSAQMLPRVVESSGELAEIELLGVRLPLLGLAGDQQAALHGQGCFAPGQAKATYGTGSFVLARTGGLPDPPHGLLATAAAQPGAFALEGSVFVAGAAIQWLRDGLGVIADAGETEALARSVDSTGGVWFVPALTGLGSPHWEPGVRGLICGLSRGTGRAELVRAALEAIAFQTGDVLAAMPGELASLRVDGGATANGYLMQFQADLLGLPVEVAADPEMTALGAAGLAGLGLGWWTRGDLAGGVRVSAVYEPAMARDEAETLRHGWHAALARARLAV
jgi:glycerol kinase